MSQLPADQLAARLRALPVHHDEEHWEVDLITPSLPKGAQPREILRAAVCLSTADAAGMVPPNPASPPDDTFALRAVAACALDQPAPGASPLEYLPGEVHVRALPPRMLEHMRCILEPLGVAIAVKPKLPRVERFFEIADEISELADESGQLPALPDALMLSPGMSLDRVRTFAIAAAVFFTAKPWKSSPGDLWHITSPVPDPAFSFLTTMGSGGAEFGVGFYRSIEQFESLFRAGHDPAAFWSKNKETIWSITFDELDAAVPEDAMLWQREHLPRSGKGLIPVPLGAVTLQQVVRPDPRTLSFMEGVLRALARIETKHIREGKLTATVQTFDGPMKFELVRIDQPNPAANRPAKPAAGLQLKVSIKGGKPPIWRRILVRDDATLEELHLAIQIAFNWADYHIHEFTVGGRRFVGEPDGGAAVDAMWGGGDDPPTFSVLLRELDLAPDSKLTYTYDFGDYWEHSILVEKLLTGPELDAAMTVAAGWKLDQRTPTPVAAVVTGKRAGPIEDSGGIGGYAELCAIMADPSHPEHADRRNWVEADAANSPGKAGFDPERFEPASINRIFKKCVV